jgi:CheY-like chemotaxis protein
MTPHSPPPRHLQILLVEEDIVNQEFAANTLEKQGHTVVTAGSGKEALAARDKLPFDLILTQVEMPGMDGCELAAAIRQTEKGTLLRVPIVGMTSDTDCRNRCLLAGMHGIILRPIQPKELFDAIERQLLAPIMDWDGVLAGVSDDMELFVEVCDHVLRDWPSMLTQIRIAIFMKDAAYLKKAAHTAKGCSSFFASKDISQAARTLEAMGADRNLAGAEEAFAILERGVWSLLTYLAPFAGADPRLEAAQQVSDTIKALEGRFVTSALQPTGQVFDEGTFSVDVKVNRQVLTHLSGIFLANRTYLMFAIQQAVARGDCRELERSAHTLKNLAGILCGWRVWEAASTLEKMGQEGCPTLEAYNLLEAAVGDFERCLQEFLQRISASEEASTT